MADEQDDEFRVSKKVIYEQSEGSSSRQSGITLLFIVIVAIAILVFIFLQMR